VWKSPGETAAYSSFIVGTFGGKRQIVGCDAKSIGGWDPDTGKRLWSLVPPAEGDFNVPTLISADGRLIACSENNATRLYGFKPDGTIDPAPIAVNKDVAPDSHSPVLYENMLFSVWDQTLFCLEAANLKPLWSWKDKALKDYVSVIAGNQRLLVTTLRGELILLDVNRQACNVISRLYPFTAKETEVYSHPALTRGRLFVRGAGEVICLSLDESELAVTPGTEEMTLFDGALDNWQETDFYGRGKVSLKDGAVYLERGNDMTGITWAGPLIRSNYEVTLQAMRVEGEDFFCGLTFPAGRYPCTLICGGWGGSLVGLSSIDYFDAANNETGTSYHFEKGKWYDIRLRVTEDKIQAWISDESIVDLTTTGRKLGIRLEVDPARPLGISTWQTTGAIRNVRLKRVAPEPASAPAALCPNPQPVRVAATERSEVDGAACGLASLPADAGSTATDAAATAPAPLPFSPVTDYTLREVEGFQVLVHRQLGHDHPDLARQVLRRLEDHLYRISVMLPESAVVRLRKVTIWVEYRNRPELHPCMCYHPSREWLSDHGFNPDKAGTVEIAGAENFLTWTKDQPWMVLHELAHAWHHQVLGYEHPGVRAAYENARKGGKYDEVLHIGGRPRRHYALNNDQEYFAESAEAFFGTNDFYPFTRAELQTHDPNAFALHQTLWQQ